MGRRTRIGSPGSCLSQHADLQGAELVVGDDDEVGAARAPPAEVHDEHLRGGARLSRTRLADGTD